VKIAVMGAGGIGGYVGARLAEACEDVSFIARGSHLASLQANGLRVESPHGDVGLPNIQATAEPAEIGPVDLVLFTVKLGDTEDAARSIAPIVQTHTRIVTLQNGIDSKDMIGRHIDRDKIAAGIIYIGAHIKEPGVIQNLGGVHRMVVDRMDGDTAMNQFFVAGERATGLDTVPTDDSDRTVWDKFVSLVAFSGVTGLSRLPIGAVFENNELVDFLRQLLRENVEVARAREVVFDDRLVEEKMEFLRGEPYEFKASLLIDLEAGRPLELEWLSGRVHSLGQELDIPTPANSAVWAALSPYKNGTPQFSQEVGLSPRSIP
jgi:2-dehydropantoate 2-reductase